MQSPVALYEALATASDDKTRARLIAQAFEEFGARYPNLAEVATQGDVRESELRLQKEIEHSRAELNQKIEQLRAATEEKIERTRAELVERIEQLRGEVLAESQRLKVDLIKWLVPMMFGQIAVVAALVKIL